MTGCRRREARRSRVGSSWRSPGGAARVRAPTSVRGSAGIDGVVKGSSLPGRSSLDRASTAGRSAAITGHPSRPGSATAIATGHGHGGRGHRDPRRWNARSSDGAVAQAPSEPGRTTRPARLHPPRRSHRRPASPRMIPGCGVSYGTASVCARRAGIAFGVIVRRTSRRGARREPEACTRAAPMAAPSTRPKARNAISEGLTALLCRPALGHRVVVSVAAPVGRVNLTSPLTSLHTSPHLTPLSSLTPPACHLTPAQGARALIRFRLMSCVIVRDRCAETRLAGRRPLVRGLDLIRSRMPW